MLRPKIYVYYHTPAGYTIIIGRTAADAGRVGTPGAEILRGKADGEGTAMKADKKSVTHKIKIARGQLDAVLKMIEEDQYCVDISTQLLAAQALLKSANQQILEAHIRHCVSDAIEGGDEAVRREKVDEALSLIEKMTRG